MNRNIILLDLAETDTTRIVSVSIKRIDITNGYEELEEENFYRKIDSDEYLFDTEKTLEGYFEQLEKVVKFKIFVWNKDKEVLFRKSFPKLKDYELNYVQSKIIKIGLTNRKNPVSYTLRETLGVFELEYDKSKLGVTRYGVDIFSLILQRLIVFLERKSDKMPCCKMESGLVHKESCQTLRRTRDKEYYNWIDFLWEEASFCKHCISFKIEGPFYRDMSNKQLKNEGVFLKAVKIENKTPEVKIIDEKVEDNIENNVVAETIDDINDIIYEKNSKVITLPNGGKIEIFYANDSLLREINILQKKQKEEKSELKKNIIEHQILLFKLGKLGEENVLEELKYSFYPMTIYKDVLIRLGELHCQIDFLIITKKMIYIIECKNHNTNVKIDKFGSFYSSELSKSSRTFSALNQVEKQLMIFKNLEIDMNFQKIQPIIVYAHESTAIEIEEESALRGVKVINLDQLVHTIRKIEEENIEVYTDEQIEKIKKDILKINVTSNFNSSLDKYWMEYEVRSLLEKNVIEKRILEKEIEKNSLKAPAAANLIKKEEKFSYSEFDELLTRYLNRKAEKLGVFSKSLMTTAMKEEIIEKLPTTEKQLSKLLVRNSLYYNEISNDLLSIINNIKGGNIL